MGTLLNPALDAPTGPLRDQRTMIGLRIHRSRDEVEQAWREYVETHGIPIRRRQGDYSTDLHESRKVVVAYVSGGKWIADCPACNDGIACWWGNPKGCCLGCGTIYHVDNPPIEDTARAAELLGKRPHESTRNWHRHRGETLDELEAENDQMLIDVAGADGLIVTVALDDVARVLGKKALAKLQAEGVV